MSKNTPNSCTQCGAPLPADAGHCARCGQAAHPAPDRPEVPGASVRPPRVGPLARAAHSAQPEAIVAILTGLQQRKGFLGLRYQTYSLIVTPRRLVFARVSAKLMNQAVAQSRAEAKDQGRGFFGQWAAQFGWLTVLEQSYRKTPVDTILTQYPGSFTLLSAEVRRITANTDEDDDSGKVTTELRIETTSGKYRFLLAGKTADEALRILREAMPSVVP